MKMLVVVISLTVFPQFAFAQSPYAGMQTRAIKALSDQQIADLRAGRGMGMALPAELNGYPGPAHVLETGGQARTDARSASQRSNAVSEESSCQPGAVHRDCGG